MKDINYFVSLQVNINRKVSMRKYLLVLLILVCCSAGYATHQRAGEITYVHQDGLSYLFTITTYTYTNSPADRPEIDVYWGDGSFSTIERSVSTELGNEIKLNQYVMAHTFPAQGTYHITFEDPNRNAGIVNIPNSVNIPFFLETILVIHPFLGANSSPQLLTRPVDNGCTHVPYYHNPGAYDPDGDSLVYSLITCRGFEGLDIPGYTLPSASNYISIDSHTGDLTWDVPMNTGEYNVAILIEEFRNGVLIGSVVRDMQITIAPCNNQPAVIQTIIDTCVTAGELLHFPISVTDEITQIVTLTATGGVFLIAPYPAYFPSSESHPPFTQYFSWQTHCLHVKKNPYQVVFKATDNGVPVALSSFKSVFITVVAPKPEGLTAIATANQVALSWLPEECANAKGYFVYKRRGSFPFEPDYCQTGIPEDKGYELIGTVEGRDNTTFIDDGSVMSLYHSNNYCYRIVAFFADGAESYVSDEVCIIINSEAPRLTHVDVTNTDSIAGSIWVSWQAPPVLDTTIFLPPYEYRLFRATNLNDNYLQIYTTTIPFDTSFSDIDLNTVAYSYRYRVDLWAKSADGELVLVEKSDPASSIFLNITSHDHALSLSWTEQTPWQNYSFTVFRYDESNSLYDSVGVTQKNYFLDKR
ncbi:MAG: hypothetical protein LBU51_10655, partial [Bacteroidales bacterium]|nr:hypothetical protein [Bacteroidales bacterium]